MSSAISEAITYIGSSSNGVLVVLHKALFKAFVHIAQTVHWQDLPRGHFHTLTSEAGDGRDLIF